MSETIMIKIDRPPVPSFNNRSVFDRSFEGLSINLQKASKMRKRVYKTSSLMVVRM